MPVTMVDLRPLPVSLRELSFVQGTILDLPFDAGTVPSLSCLCVVEHIGLGRYGDPLQPDGTERAIAELLRVVQPGGHLYLSAPVDDCNRTYFNAHRAFTDAYLRRRLEPCSIISALYIYGRRTSEQPMGGFGTACYHAQKPDAG